MQLRLKCAPDLFAQLLPSKNNTQPFFGGIFYYFSNWFVRLLRSEKSLLERLSEYLLIFSLSETWNLTRKHKKYSQSGNEEKISEIFSCGQSGRWHVYTF